MRVSRRYLLRNCVGPLGLVALTGCNVRTSGSSGSSAPAIQDATATTPAPAPPLFANARIELDRIRRQPSAFVSSYAALGGKTSTPLAAVRSALGTPFQSLTDEGAVATYGAFMSFNAAPAGIAPDDPLTASICQLLSANSLTCGHYCKLATLLTTLAYPQIVPGEGPDVPEQATVHVVVWRVNAPYGVGYHAQLVVTNVLTDAYLLLDPMYAVAVAIPFNSTYPDPSLSPIENAAALLATPPAAGSIVILDGGPAPDKPRLIAALATGEINQSFIYHDSIFGSEAWDDVIARSADFLEPECVIVRPRPPP